jgi:enterochelin esterase family protein
VSPQIEADRRVTFRVLAPSATSVSVGGDINNALEPDPAAPPQAAPAVSMTKGDNGVWSGTTVRPVRPGAWCYTFNIDGVTVVDARNVKVMTSQTQVQSLLVVPGDFSETRDVPHGTVGAVRYVAKTLANARRELYVYTPPGYEKGTGRYPVLYLIHGGGDTALSWSTVGRANDILDNLLAEKKAVPMIVVMPSGWTPSGGQVMTAEPRRIPSTTN